MSGANLEEVDWLLEETEPQVSAATRKLRMLRSLRCGNKFERAARAQGATIIAGVDEVGRGSLFGPVVAAAVILPIDSHIRGLRDSKQLTIPDRERLAGIVQKLGLKLEARKSPLPVIVVDHVEKLPSEN